MQNFSETMNVDRKSANPKYGDWKFSEEVELSDLLEHPIWIDCMLIGMAEGYEDTPFGGDETSRRPLLTSDNVLADVRHAEILLKVEDSDHFASGIYNCHQRNLSCITVYNKDGSLCSKEDLPDFLNYIAVPKIQGMKNVRFLSIEGDISEAEAVNEKA